MTFHLKRKGLSISRLTEKLLYATSCRPKSVTPEAKPQKEENRQKCWLHFSDGEALEYNYRLNILEKDIAGSGMFRVHRCYFLKLKEVTGYADHQAKLSNNELIPLNESGYELVRNFIDKGIHP